MIPEPEAMIVPCIWDNQQQIYVPVYSHRGVEIKARIEQLETALRKYAGSCNGTCCPEENRKMMSCGSIARAALGEKKDD